MSTKSEKQDNQPKSEYSHTYLRNRKRERVGVVLATKDGIGWSKCAVKKGDKFDRNTGIEIALVRAREVSVNLKDKEIEVPANMPDDVVKHIFKISEKAKRYFHKSQYSVKTAKSTKSTSHRKNLSRKTKITTKAVSKTR